MTTILAYVKRMMSFERHSEGVLTKSLSHFSPMACFDTSPQKMAGRIEKHSHRKTKQKPKRRKHLFWVI